MTITLLGFVLGLLLLAIPLYVSNVFGIKMEGKLLKALLSFLFVLVVSAALCFFCVDANNPGLTYVTPFVFLGAAAAMVTGLAKRKSMRLYLSAFCGLAAGLIVVGAFVVLAVLGGGTAWGPRVYVPLGLMLLTVMAYTNGKALRTYLTGLQYHGRLYTYLRANGAKHREAVAFFIRRAMQNDLMPFARRMVLTSLGIGTPLAFGMVMTGGNVLTAFAFELLFLVASMAASTVSFLVMLWLVRRYAFDGYDALRRNSEPTVELAETVDESQKEQEMS